MLRNIPAILSPDLLMILRAMGHGDEIVIAVDLGLGSGEAVAWTCDLTHRYIEINADYRS